jgi:hypothetical protein
MRFVANPGLARLSDQGYAMIVLERHQYRGGDEVRLWIAKGICGASPPERSPG